MKSSWKTRKRGTPRQKGKKFPMRSQSQKPKLFKVKLMNRLIGEKLKVTEAVVAAKNKSEAKEILFNSDLIQTDMNAAPTSEESLRGKVRITFGKKKKDAPIEEGDIWF